MTRILCVKRVRKFSAPLLIHEQGGLSHPNSSYWKNGDPIKNKFNFNQKINKNRKIHSKNSKLACVMECFVWKYKNYAKYFIAINWVWRDIAIRRSKHKASLRASLKEMFLRPPPVRDALRKLHVNSKYMYTNFHHKKQYLLYELTEWSEKDVPSFP